MQLLLLALLLGCGDDEPRPSGVTAFPDLRAPSGDRSIPLHTRAGRYSFAAPTLAGLEDLADDFALEVEEIPNPRGVQRKLKVLRARLPFNVPGGRFAPPGLTVSILSLIHI